MRQESDEDEERVPIEVHEAALRELARVQSRIKAHHIAAIEAALERLKLYQAHMHALAEDYERRPSPQGRIDLAAIHAATRCALELVGEAMVDAWISDGKLRPENRDGALAQCKTGAGIDAFGARMARVPLGFVEGRSVGAPAPH